MPGLSVGDQAPKFKLRDQSGKVRALDEWKGRRLLVFFYPEAGSPGCTTQLCGYRDLSREFATLDIDLVGISPDEPQALDRFARENRLKMTLLADSKTADGTPKTASDFGIWHQKQLYGKTYVGLVRSAFLIDQQSRIARAWTNVKATGQAARMLRDIRADAQRVGKSTDKPRQRRRSGALKARS